MTVCIAALADNSEKAVLIADQMITARIPIAFEYQTEDVKKIHKMAEHVYALSAGDAMNAHRIISGAQKEISQRVKDLGSSSLDAFVIADVVRSEFQKLRKDIIAKRYLEPRGLTLSSYQEVQHKLNQRIAHEIDDLLINYDINVEFIVVGYDGDRQCHIYTVTHPGQINVHDALGYASVGSGAPHAMYCLIGSNYRKALPLEDVQKIVEQAKKMSEKAPGVGQLSTEKIISPNDEA